MIDERLESIIRLTQKYSELKNINNILNYLTLIPTIKTNQPCKKWLDPYGLSLNLNSSKKILIKSEPIKSIDKDLLSGISFENCLKITKKICVVFSKDDLLNSEFKYYTCFCLDNKIRSYLYFNNKIKKCSSLYLGYNILSSFIDNINLEQRIKIVSKILEFSQDQFIVIDNYPLSKQLDL